MKERLLLLVLALALLFGGCSTDTTEKTFKYDIPGPVDNLDPQFATDATARMIISNIYEGLLVPTPEGKLRPGVAKSYSLSPDGLIYTFILRENTSWWDTGKDSHGKAVTAQDFAFALQRILAPGAASPFADDFLSIKNAREVLAGNLTPDSLGIEAPDPRTLRITLEEPDPLFLENLASTAAMPCDRSFFEEARGKYGLGRAFIRSNGPFYLQRWDNEKYILLAKNKHYTGEQPVIAGGVNLYIGRGDPAERFLSGTTDLARLSGAQSLGLDDNETVATVEKTVWCVVFNQSDAVWGNPLLRQGLVAAVDRTQLSGHLAAGLTSTGTLVPPAMRILDRPYRELAGSTPPLAFDPARGKELFDKGLLSLGLASLPVATLYVPETDDHALYAGLVQQNWQQYLSAFINIERTTAHNIEQRLVSGDYQMLLMPFSPAGPRVDSLLGVFSSHSSQNYFGYHSSVYDMMLQSAAHTGSAEEAAAGYARAEALLLGDAVILPLYGEATCYAMGDTVSGIEIFPFGGQVYFKYAQKAK